MTACHQNPFLTEWNTPYGIPPFNEIRNSDYLPAVKEGIKQQNAEIQAIIDNPAAPDFENVIAAFDRSGDILEKVGNVLFNVSESDASDELNAIVDEAMPLFTAQSDEIFMNKDFYAKVKAVYEADQSSLSREQQMLLKDIYESFENTGIGLDEAGQARLKEINTELASLALTFGNNLLDESNAFKAEFGFSVANYYDKMASTADRDLRERIFNAYSHRGNNGNAKDNKAAVLRTMELRIEKASLLGYSSPAEWILHDKMAGNSATVDAFLSGIMEAAMKRASEEVADMQKLMDEDIAAGLLPAGSTIRPWDYMYYAERVRKARYNLDEEEVMQYFKMENVRAGVFGNASRLYGVSFEPFTGVELYNPECEAFKVSDADGSLIGIIITDYYPRDSKRAGAWMTNFVNQCEGVRPVIVNVGNFNKPDGDKPALLNIDQVETMFHEFGHALHSILSRCHYRSLSGTNVPRDYVEMPSQFMEHFSTEPEVLKMYAHHYKTGETIPDALIAKMEAAATYGQGFINTELLAASLLDMDYHTITSKKTFKQPDYEKQQLEKIGLIPSIISRYKSPYFQHIFSGGYGAGYYSYTWAAVLDNDAFEAFKENGIFDQATATAFRTNILERGNTDDAMNLYVAFRGKEPSIEPLLRNRGLK